MGDRIVDRDANQVYCSVQVEADVRRVADAGDLKRLAGMPAEVYLKGEQRTQPDYLLEPPTRVDATGRARTLSQAGNGTVTLLPQRLNWLSR